MIRYFVAYTYTNRTGFGFGNCQINLDQPIRSYEDITIVTNMLRKQVTGHPVVTSFCRFDSDAEDGATR